MRALRGMTEDYMYKTFPAMKLLFLVFILFGIIVAFVHNQILMYLYIVTVFVGANFANLMALKNDYYTNWYKYERILPIKLKTIIISKFLGNNIYILMSLVWSAAYILILEVQNNHFFDYGASDVYTLLCLILSITLIHSSIYFALVFAVSFEKSELYIITSFIIALLLVILTIVALNAIGISRTFGNVILIAIGVLIQVISYFVAVKLNALCV